MEKDSDNKKNYISAIDNILTIIEEKMSETIQNLHIYSWLIILFTVERISLLSANNHSI